MINFYLWYLIRKQKGFKTPSKPPAFSDFRSSTERKTVGQLHRKIYREGRTNGKCRNKPCPCALASPSSRANHGSRTHNLYICWRTRNRGSVSSSLRRNRLLYLYGGIIGEKEVSGSTARTNNKNRTPRAYTQQSRHSRPRPCPRFCASKLTH
ncbi:hypothetical protein Trydic_g2070 [Trypoxylus dichotomus]